MIDLMVESIFIIIKFGDVLFMMRVSILRAYI